MTGKQKGGTLLGLVIGALIGLAVALAAAVYISKMPAPFTSKAPVHSSESDAAESVKNRNWNPNASLAGKNGVKPGPAVSGGLSTPPAAQPEPEPEPPPAKAVPDPVRQPDPVARVPKAIAPASSPANRLATIWPLEPFGDLAKPVAPASAAKSTKSTKPASADPLGDLAKARSADPLGDLAKARSGAPLGDAAKPVVPESAKAAKSVSADPLGDFAKARSGAPLGDLAKQPVADPVNDLDRAGSTDLLGELARARAAKAPVGDTTRQGVRTAPVTASKVVATTLPAETKTRPAAAPAESKTRPAPTETKPRPAAAPAEKTRPAAEAGKNRSTVVPGDVAKVRAVSPVPDASAEAFKYYIQAGAFRTPEEAEKQRAKLEGLAGMQARVSGRQQDGRTVYRVRMGPFKKKEDADRIKSRLDNQSSSIETTMVRTPR